MSFVSISDIHVQNNKDERYQNLLRFMRHPKTILVDEVFFLGDIFDLMVGPHLEYLEIYHEFFDELKNLISTGKIVHYFEGNHDLHIKKLFRKVSIDLKTTKGELKIHQYPLKIKFENIQYYLSHGDELEPGNYSYKVYKTILLSKPLEMIATHAPYKMIEAIGNRASSLSKKRGKRYYREDKNRDKFRHGALRIAKDGNQVIITGHSHIKENIELKINDKTFHYYNNGFFSETLEFLSMQNNKVEFISLR